MSLKMPSQNSELRELFETEMLVNWRELPVYNNALISARKTIKNSEGRIYSIDFIAMRANGDLNLIRVGPRGGAKKLWNFGNPVK